MRVSVPWPESSRPATLVYAACAHRSWRENQLHLLYNSPTHARQSHNVRENTDVNSACVAVAVAGVAVRSCLLNLCFQTARVAPLPRFTERTRESLANAYVSLELVF